MTTRSQKFGSACKEYEADLVLHYYGDCSEPERRRVARHLKQCLCCRRFSDDLCRLLPGMSEPRELPPGFWERYYRETLEKLSEHQERARWWHGLLAPVRFWSVPAFGTVGVFILALTLFFGKGGLNLPRQQSQEMMPEEILADSSKLDFFKDMDLLESLRLLETLEGSRVDPEAVNRS